MLVRDQDRVELFGVLVDGCQPRNDIALAQPGVDQDARLFGANEGGVSGTTAGENADLDYSAPPRGPA